MTPKPTHLHVRLDEGTLEALRRQRRRRGQEVES